jgi:hypothetical protein
LKEQENIQAHHRMSEGAYISLAVKSKGHKTLINAKGIPYELTYEVTNIKN